MSVALRLRAKLPEGDVNGLAMLGAAVRHDPGTRILVALVAPVSVTEDLETGDEVLALGIESVELTDLEEARELLAKLYSARTGVERLPFGDTDAATIVGDLAGELVAAAKAAGLDVTTGELTTPTTSKPRKRSPRPAATKGPK